MLAEGSILLNDPLPISIPTSLSPQIPFKSKGRNLYISHFPSRLNQNRLANSSDGAAKLQRRWQFESIWYVVFCGAYCFPRSVPFLENALCPLTEQTKKTWKLVMLLFDSTVILQYRWLEVGVFSNVLKHLKLRRKSMQDIQYIDLLSSLVLIQLQWLTSHTWIQCLKPELRFMVYEQWHVVYVCIHILVYIALYTCITYQFLFNNISKESPKTLNPNRALAYTIQRQALAASRPKAHRPDAPCPGALGRGARLDDDWSASSPPRVGLNTSYVIRILLVNVGNSSIHGAFGEWINM